MQTCLTIANTYKLPVSVQSVWTTDAWDPTLKWTSMEPLVKAARHTIETKQHCKESKSGVSSLRDGRAHCAHSSRGLVQRSGAPLQDVSKDHRCQVQCSHRCGRLFLVPGPFARLVLAPGFFRTVPSHMLAVFVKIRFSAGLWQRTCYAVLSCRVLSSCCCASVFVAKCGHLGVTGAYNFNLSTRLHESQRQSSLEWTPSSLSFVTKLSCGLQAEFRVGFRYWPSVFRDFRVPSCIRVPQGRSLLLTEKAR